MGDAVTIDDVIRDLRLGEYGEDWAIINADGTRLAEFTEYVLSHAERLDDSGQGDLLELVLASADKVVRAGAPAESAAGEVQRVLAAVGRGDLVRLILDYWRGYWGKQADERLPPLLASLACA